MIERFRIELEREKLNREVWEFWYCEGKLYVESYSVESRKTARHGWEIRRQYNRLSKPGGYYGSIVQIPHKAVPLTGGIRNMALDTFIKGITVQMWEDTHKR